MKIYTQVPEKKNVISVNETKNEFNVMQEEKPASLEDSYENRQEFLYLVATDRTERAWAMIELGINPKGSLPYALANNSVRTAMMLVENRYEDPPEGTELQDYFSLATSRGQTALMEIMVKFWGANPNEAGPDGRKLEAIAFDKNTLELLNNLRTWKEANDSINENARSQHRSAIRSFH